MRRFDVGGAEQPSGLLGGPCLASVFDIAVEVVDEVRPSLDFGEVA